MRNIPLFLWASTLAELFLEARCLARFSGGRARPVQYLPFLAAGCGLGVLPAPLPARIGILWALLCLWGILALGMAGRDALLGALLAAAASQLAFGGVNALSSLLAPALFARFPAEMGRVFPLAGEALALSLLWRFPARPVSGRADFLLPPLAAIAAAGLCLTGGVYRAAAFGGAEGGLPWLHGGILAACLLSAASVFALLDFQGALAAGLRRAAALEGQNRLYRRYAEQARIRVRRTRAMRHDIQNHLAVIRGLRDRGQAGAAEDYRFALSREVADLSFPFQTGSPALDVLLEEKAALAAGLGAAFSCALELPPDCPAGDPELCLLLSNALDNALHACGAAAGERFIRVEGRCQGDFLCLEVENSRAGDGPVRPGTGLANIRRTAERYGGRAELLPGEGCFRLRILLDLSQRPGDRSQQIY